MSVITNKQQNDAVDEIDLMALFHQVMEHKWLILLITSMMLSIGIFYASKQVPQYKSSVLLQIESKQQNLGQAGGVIQLLGGGQGAESASTQMALIQSRFILKPVIQSLGLDINVSIKRTFWSLFHSSNNKKINIEIKSFKVPHDQVNNVFKLVVDKPGHVRLYNGDGGLVLQGTVGSAISNSSKTIRLEINTINAPIGTEFVLKKSSAAAEIQSLLNRLKIADTGAVQRQNTGILDVSLTGPDPIKVVRTLNAIAKIAEAKDAQKKSQEASQTLAFLYKQLPITKGELEKSETALNRYRAKSGKIDIKLQATFLLDQLKELDKQLTTLRISKIDNLQKYTMAHPILLALDTQTKALEDERRQLEQQLKRLPASDQIAVNLLRDVGVKKTLYLILLNKIQELQVMKAGTISSVHILSKATLPDAALPKKRIIIYLGSMLVGFFISMLIIFARKLANPSVDDPHWSERHYNIANLAIIPFCKEQADYKQGVKNKSLKIAPLLAHANPRSLTIESLRSLRTSLQVTLSVASNNVISILGVTPGVGKSFISTNLAYLLSAAGKRVVIVDGDLRRGTVHKYFNAQPAPGVSEVVNGTATLEQALVVSLNDNLTFLPRGTYPTDPSELLMGEPFKLLIRTLSSQYDVVIIDTPPVLLVTDAVLIASLSATNYLILGAAAHQPAEIEMVLKRLSTAGVQVHGTIFNFYRSATINSSYGQYGKYNTYYYDESTLVKNQD